jgi:PhoH-like ATPase
MTKRDRKLFVLDTNVLIHDPSCIFRFKEHDICIPITVLEELDTIKRGMSEVARSARQVSRYLDELLQDAEGDLAKGLKLPGTALRNGSGRLFFFMDAVSKTLPAGLTSDKPDNAILAVAMELGKKHRDTRVVLVTKDINLRIKAHALSIPAEDYTSDQAVDDTTVLFSGAAELPADFWQAHGDNIASWNKDGRTFYRLHGPNVPTWYPNEFVFIEGDQPFEGIVHSVERDNAVIEVIRDYSNDAHNVWGITARNREQNFALHLLMDPDIDFVSLLGHAGTGKTLLTLAAALSQTLDERRYTEIIVTRVTVPVGEDIGFLPGTEEEKMSPWMGALEDNLDVLVPGAGIEGGSWGRAATQDLVRNRVRIKSLNFMRGRTFLNKFLIIDEAQNLTPHQMKTLVTRAGSGSKVVCLGNIAQIDTPYLTETTSGLTYVVDRFKNWEHSGHITLKRVERSRLADYANDIL